MIYYKKEQEIEESEIFIYKEELYLIFPGRWELFRTKTYTSKVPINRKNSCAYSNAYKCNIQRYWELEAAPKQYLISKGFKPKQ